MANPAPGGRESALNEILIAASSLLDPSRLAAVSVAQVRRLLDVDGASLSLWDSDQRVLVPLAFDDARMTDPDPVFHPGQGLSGEAFARNMPVVASDYARELAHPLSWTSARSGAAVPLRADNGAVGALSAQHYSPRRFDERDIELLELVAAQVGPALATMRTLARAQRRTAEAYALATLMRRGTVLADEKELFSLVCETAARLLGADLAGLVLNTTVDGSAWRGVFGNRTDVWRRRRYGGDNAAAATIFGDQLTVVHGPGGGVFDPDEFPFFAAESIRSGIAVPLGTDGPARGSLCVGWRFNVDPAEGQLELARALAAFSGTLVAGHVAGAQRDALVQSAPVALAAIDADGILTLCVGAAATAIGLGPDDVGRHLSELLADEPVALDQLLDAGRQPGPVAIHLKLRGHEFDAEVVTRDSGAFLVATDVTERLAAERQLAWRATHDPLTELPNKAEVERRIEAELPNQAMTVALADVRSFDHVNEAIGYSAGDELLRILGRRLAEDLPDAVVVGRTGGDEFAVVARETDPQELAARVRASLEHEVPRSSGATISVDVRCGVAWADAGEETLLLLRHADAALQTARRGTEAVRAWSEDAAAHHRVQLALVAKLRGAVDARAFGVDYQPIVDAATGALRSIEALARWTPASGEPVGPTVFVPLLERLGRVSQLTAHVLERALTDVAGPHLLAVSVNVSPLDVMHGDLVKVVADQLSARGLDPAMLTLEITETAALEAGTAGLEQLVSLGVSIAIDDFGHGWSSLELLKRLPARYLKLDRSYVAGVTEDPADEAIVRAAVTLGHALGMEVVAEGVAEPAIHDAVQRLGCDLIQGYHVARPMAVEALEGWLTDHG